MPDQNGNRLYLNIRHEPGKGWGANVWFGSHCATSLSRRYYETRKDAKKADVSDEIGKRGCIGFGEYLAPTNNRTPSEK